MNKTKLANTVFFTTITGAEIQIVVKIFSLFLGQFCFVMICAKTIAGSPYYVF
jgi:hypothetical protein